MLKMVSAALASLVSLVLLGNCAVAQPPQPPHGGPRGNQSIFERIEKVKGLNLTDDQKSKIAELKKEYEPKLKEARAKLEGVTTAEQKQARDKAVKEARDAGKRGREVFEAGTEAQKLTEEQKTKLGAAWKALGDLNKDVHGKVMNLLTPDQKELLKKAREERRSRRVD
jgi:Spy/CpxP family protein refolding chaperone